MKAILFTAEWCGPCKRVKPMFEELADERPDVEFVMADVMAERELAKQYYVRSVPTLVVVSDKGIVEICHNPVNKGQMRNLL